MGFYASSIQFSTSFLENGVLRLFSEYNQCILSPANWAIIILCPPRNSDTSALILDSTQDRFNAGIPRNAKFSDSKYKIVLVLSFIFTYGSASGIAQETQLTRFRQWHKFWQWTALWDWLWLIDRLIDFKVTSIC